MVTATHGETPTRGNTKPKEKKTFRAQPLERYGDTLLGYSGGTTLRREQCNIYI
jgi:hypothetical protein